MMMMNLAYLIQPVPNRRKSGSAKSLLQTPAPEAQD